MYQFWDSLQGLTSYVRGVITTQILLEGVGVGSSDASSSAAALSWVLRDGIGMLATLLFAYEYADAFEVNTKEWRLFADVCNNIGLTLDMMVSIFPSYFAMLTGLSACSKACCGLIAGATKARISAHFAVAGHLADVTAKESTQETAVTLVGLVVGMVCTRVLDTGVRQRWMLFIFLLFLHQWANYMLIRTLVFDTLNPQKCYLLAAPYFHIDGSKSADSSAERLACPLKISQQETLIRPLYLAYYGPQLGVSIRSLVDTLNKLCGGKTMLKRESVDVSWSAVVNIWQSEAFVIGIDIHLRPLICFRSSENPNDSTERDSNIPDKVAFKAYVIACYLQFHCWKRDELSYKVGSQLQTVKQLYSNLIERDAKVALCWYSTVIEPRYEKEMDSASAGMGWNLSNGGARLGIGSWRFRSNSLAHNHTSVAEGEPSNIKKKR